MSSAIPDRLNTALSGRYRIERELGAGGMATVYLAFDEKHDRKVAIKVLKPELAAVLGAERFVVEIKTTAAMSHPHILPLFDSGTADGFLFYVMPYIEGETIREKLNRETQFGVDEAVRIAREVADALDYAHRHGVIHRDIKPENLLLHDGRAMVMDFGIALAVSAAAGGRMTETGLSLGTPHYMSPEQATAEKEITARADQYSLASVLYEMLTGNPPHTGAAAQQVIMKIITESAEPVTKYRKAVPAIVSAAVAKALEKLPADRFESAKAFADALGNATFAGSGGASGRGGALNVQSRRYRRLAIGTAAALVVALAALGWSLRRSPRGAGDDPVVRTALNLPRGDRFYPSGTQNIAVTPQGDRVAYVTQNGPTARTMIRRTSELEGREVVPTLGNDFAFSPNGRWLAYIEANQIKKVSADGGAGIPIATLTSVSVRGLAWLSQDTILVGSLAGLYSVPAAGGTLRPVQGFPVDSGCFSPVLLPDGSSVACSAGVGTAARRIRVGSRVSRKATILDLPAAAPLGMQDGHLIYVTALGALMAVPFDLAAQRVTGDASEIEAGILLSAANAMPFASLAPNGTLAYLAGASTRRLVLSAAGRLDVPLMDESRAYRYPRFSPDGRKVAVTVIGPDGSDIWVFDRVGHTYARLTFTGAQLPEWSPDGAKILFRVAAPREIWWQAADGSTKAELLYTADEAVNEAVLSPDGKWLVYRTSPLAQHVRDIFAVPLEGDRKPILLAGGDFQETHPRISPDGHWMVYQSNASGRFEIYVRPFPGAGSRTQVSSDGGSEPLWSRSGRELYYRTSAGLVTASVTTGAKFTIGERRTKSVGESFDDATHAGYDVGPDGQLLMLRPSGSSVTGVLVHNWGRVLREKLGLVKK